MDSSMKIYEGQTSREHLSELIRNRRLDKNSG